MEIDPQNEEIQAAGSMTPGTSPKCVAELAAVRAAELALGLARAALVRCRAGQASESPGQTLRTTGELIHRLWAHFRAFGACRCGGPMDGSGCDNHTPVWNPCPDSEAIHDAIMRIELSEHHAREARAWRDWHEKCGVDAEGDCTCEGVNRVKVLNEAMTWVNCCEQDMIRKGLQP